MSKLPTLYAVYREGQSFHGFAADIDPHVVEKEADRRTRQTGVLHRVVHFLPESESIPKERVRELVEKIATMTAEAEVRRDEAESLTYVNQHEGYRIACSHIVSDIRRLMDDHSPDAGKMVSAERLYALADKWDCQIDDPTVKVDPCAWVEELLALLK